MASSAALLLLLCSLALCTAFTPLISPLRGATTTRRGFQLCPANHAVGLRMAANENSNRVDRRSSMIQGAAFVAALSFRRPASAGSSLDALRSEVSSTPCHCDRIHFFLLASSVPPSSSSSGTFVSGLRISSITAADFDCSFCRNITSRSVCDARAAQEHRRGRQGGFALSC